ncbi:hypothetical protein N7505_001258 [Penicillium chrysogenum]|uniref:Hemerythrin-like domain-containing protein n=1 Tax=Penicillium chrysogenum TaxID=5076 RepID=A0ABQ8WWH7_PENCH|nr:hypothetical protein N7505_001258 [Penicillium chrysogenum]
MATSHSNWILIGTILITMFRRGIATSPIAIPPGISDPIKRDHRKIESYYGKITNSSDKDEQTLFQNLSVQLELAQHSIGEELVVYPVFETLLADGADIAIKDRKEHLKVKRALKAFQDMTTSDTQFISTIKELMENLSEHIKEEETDDLPKLEVALSQEDSQSNAKSFGRTKMFVPSRAHPSAPDKPPFETVAGLLTAPIDHLADLFRKWPDTSGMPNPSTK